MEKNTAEYIGYVLTTNDKAVERAIVVLYNRQTNDEKRDKNTRHRNGRGFNGADARIGSYLAEWILKGNRLSGKWMLKARELAFFYMGQLVEEATLKLERESSKQEYTNSLRAIETRIDREVSEELAILEER